MHLKNLASSVIRREPKTLGMANDRRRPTQNAYDELVNSEANDRENQESFVQLEQAGFQALLLDQITKIQEQNELIKTRLIQLEKEQDEFYLSTCRRMENGFREVDNCVKEMSSIKEVFKEIVGIMSGERVRFVDHPSSENVTSEEAQSISNSQLLAENFADHRRRQFNEYVHDRMVLERDDNSALNFEIKREEAESLERGDQINRNPSSQHEDDLDQELDYADSHIPTSYRLNRAIHTVTDVAREYFEGLRGQPSVMSLERRYGTHWRSKPSERTFFAKRMQIINKINDIKENPEKYSISSEITRKQAIRVVENLRLGNNSFYGHSTRMTLNQLYIYLTKKMDKPEDYSLTLKEHGKPRRDLLSRERLKDTNSQSEAHTVDSNNNHPAGTGSIDEETDNS